MGVQHPNVKGVVECPESYSTVTEWY